MAHNGFAASFDHTGANKQSLVPELCVAHAFAIAIEVTDCLAYCFLGLRGSRSQPSQTNQ
jgi:hypothetical protein